MSSIRQTTIHHMQKDCPEGGLLCVFESSRCTWNQKKRVSHYPGVSYSAWGGPRKCVEIETGVKQQGTITICLNIGRKTDSFELSPGFNKTSPAPQV